MSLIDKLPLIRGWTWRRENILATVLLNQESLVYQPPTPSKEIGWIAGLDFFGNDAYLGIRVTMPGLDTGYGTFAGNYAISSVLPPASGAYILRYVQPNPLRTIGEYASSVISSAYPLPFYGSVRLYLSLRTGSTEPFATSLISLNEVVVEDRNLFLKDLRKVYFGRWAPLVDWIAHTPILRASTKKFADLGIPFEEKEVVEPPGIAR